MNKPLRVARQQSTPGAAQGGRGGLLMPFAGGSLILLIALGGLYLAAHLIHPAATSATSHLPPPTITAPAASPSPAPTPTATPPASATPPAAGPSTVETVCYWTDSPAGMHQQTCIQYTR